MDHPRSMEPPLWNVQQCYAHVDDNMGEEGAPSTGTDTRSRGAEKHPVTPDHSKKRPRSSEATGAPENLTSKHRRIIQDWSDEEEEENLTADMLNPCQRKGCRADGPRGTVETSSDTSAGNANNVNRDYITCAATK
jgi:hypothetical protein